MSSKISVCNAMTEVKLISLFSGSSGNCTAVSYGNDTVLFDAGRSARAIERGLADAGIDPATVRAVFITHEHTDHVSALRVFIKKHPVPVYAAAETADAIAPLCGGLGMRRAPLYCESIGSITVRSIPTMHDAACPVCYRVDADTHGGTVSVGIATDTGIVTDGMKEGLAGCRAVLLESNHDPDMLHTGPYPPALKSRIASHIGHLSNEDSAEFAAWLASRGTEQFILAHISKENNLPSLALDVCRARLAAAGQNAAVCAACPDTAVAVTVNAVGSTVMK